MKVLVCGGRAFGDEGGEWMFLRRSLDKIRLTGDDLIIEGGARGADQLAEQWAFDNAIPFLCIPADWSRKGKSAGILRNLRMLDFMGLKPDLVVAFPGGNGTAHMTRVAGAAGIPLWQPQQHVELPSQLSDLLRTLRDITSQERSSRQPSAESNGN